MKRLWSTKKWLVAGLLLLAVVLAVVIAIPTLAAPRNSTANGDVSRTYGRGLMGTGMMGGWLGHNNGAVLTPPSTSYRNRGIGPAIGARMMGGW